MRPARAPPPPCLKPRLVAVPGPRGEGLTAEAPGTPELSGALPSGLLSPESGPSRPGSTALLECVGAGGDRVAWVLPLEAEDVEVRFSWPGLTALS